jgi:hypothetical protein
MQHGACLLAAGVPVTHVAEQIKVVPRTIYHWLSTHEFKRHVDNLRDQLRTAVLEEATSRLAAAATLAVTRLVELLDHPDAYLRHKASVSVIDMIGKLRDRLEFARRLEALEQSRAAADKALEATMVQMADEGDVDPVQRLFERDIRENGHV